MDHLKKTLDIDNIDENLLEAARKWRADGTWHDISSYERNKDTRCNVPEHDKHRRGQDATRRNGGRWESVHGEITCT